MHALLLALALIGPSAQAVPTLPWSKFTEVIDASAPPIRLTCAQRPVGLVWAIRHEQQHYLVFTVKRRFAAAVYAHSPAVSNEAPLHVWLGHLLGDRLIVEQTAQFVEPSSSHVGPCTWLVPDHDSVPDDDDEEDTDL